MSLLEQCLVPIRAGPGEVYTQCGKVGAEPLVQCDAGGELFVVREDLLREFVHKLVKAQVHLGFDFVVEELLLEFGQCVVGRVIVEVQWVENTSS